MEPGPLGGKLDEDGDRAVRLRRGTREESVGDLARHDHGPQLERREPVEALHHERRRDVVWEVGNELRRRRFQPGEVEAEGVAEVKLDVLPAAQRVAQTGLERAVELHRVHVGDAFGQVRREDTVARPDLEHEVGWIELCETTDHAEQVLIDEEVLAERLLRHRAAHGRANAARALASSWAASSAAPTPRPSASVAIV